MTNGDGKLQPELTPRQRQILLLVAEGLTAKEIAHRMNVAAKTVAFHKSALYGRLGVRSTAALVRYALRAGLIVESDVHPPQTVFRFVFCSEELDGSPSVAHVRAIDQKQALQKLRERLSHLQALKVLEITAAEGMFIFD